MMSAAGGGVACATLRKVDWWWKGTARNWTRADGVYTTNNHVTNQSDADALAISKWQKWATNSHWQFTNELPQCNHITYICCLFYGCMPCAADEQTLTIVGGRAIPKQRKKKKCPSRQSAAYSLFQPVTSRISQGFIERLAVQTDPFSSFYGRGLSER